MPEPTPTSSAWAQRYKGLCPLHKEKTPSFSVDADKGVFYCFGCGQGGDAIRLHQLLTGDDFPAAMEALAVRYGIPLPTRPASGGRRRPEHDPTAALEAALAFFRTALDRSDKPLVYLERRQISRELIDLYQVGYAPDGWENLLGALHRKFPIKDLEAAGLVARSERAGGKAYDRFRRPADVPDSQRRRPPGGVRRADARGRQGQVHQHQRNFAIPQGAGFFTDWTRPRKTCARPGGRCWWKVTSTFWGLPPPGSTAWWRAWARALTQEQCKLLARFSDEVVIGYDGDQAGEAAATRALPLLLAAGLDVLRLEPGDGHDPDSLRLEKGPEELRRRVEQAPDAVMRQLDLLIPTGVASEPRRQARSARLVTDLLRPIPDPVLKYSYAKQAAERLAVPAELLLRRAGGAASTTGEATRSSAGPAREVRSVEEKLLQMLLAGSEEGPPLEELPPPDAFLDSVWRNIFVVFCDLYKEQGSRPEPRAVLEKLPEGGAEVDRAARLLLEGAVGSRRGEFDEALRQLERRWAQRKMRELTAQISEAQRGGDQARLERLLDQKISLSRDLHGRTEN